MNKKLLIPIVLLVVLGGAYKFVLAKPKAAEAKPKVDGTVYVLQKEFLVNLKDGRYAKLTAALVLAHDDTSTAAAGGEGASSAPEGYGAMTQEAVVRIFAHMGVLQRRMSLAGYASEQPADTNTTAVGRAHNRRVDVVLTRLHPLPKTP